MPRDKDRAREYQRAYHQKNKDAAVERVRQWRIANPKARRWEALKRQYKLTRENYYALLAQQGGVCAGCSKPPPEERLLEVDHDHDCCPKRPTCGKCVRGLLCRSCNQRDALKSNSR